MKAGSVLAALALLCAGYLAHGADIDPDLQAESTARLFQPVPGKAVIYLVRDRGDIWALGVPVYLNGRDMGMTEPLSYFRWEVEPGRHLLISGTVPPAVLELSTEAGGVYYVWQDINPGLQRADSRLLQVDLTTARATVRDATLLPNPQ